MSAHHCVRCGADFAPESWKCPRCGFEPERIDGFLSFAPELAGATDGFESHYFGALAESEAGSFWFRNRNALIQWALRKDFRAAQTALEIGCGTGYVLAAIDQVLPQAKLTGTEVLTSAFAYARQRAPRAELLQADARRLPFTDSFDVIGAFDVIEHIDDDAAVLSEMHRATTRTGGVLLTVPQHPSLWSATDDMAHHKRRYRRGELMQKLSAAGFDVLRATSFVSILLPAMIVSRRRTRTYDDAVRSLRLPRWIDASLSSAMMLERAAIRMGIRWPAGGSLLVAARKRA